MAKSKKKIDIKRITELARDIKSLEQAKKQLDEELEAAKDEIKQVMTDNKLEELLADVFTIRYKPVVSDRFDSKTFKNKYEDLYKAYLVSNTSMRLTIT